MKQQVLVSSTTASSSAASSIAANNTNAPVSRTYQYRKIMKPMLERKRRARINRCLDELKELMVIALQSEGENVAKIEKADILEHTVAYLHKLQKQNKLIRSNYDMATASATGAAQKTEIFRAGYTKCAREVSKCLAVTPGIDNENGNKLMIFLGHRLNDILSGCEVSKPVNEPVFLTTTSTNPSPIHSPSNYSCISSSSSGYGSSSYDDEWCYQQQQQQQQQLAQQPQPLREQHQQQQQPQPQQQQYINQNCCSSVWRPW